MHFRTQGQAVEHAAVAVLHRVAYYAEESQLTVQVYGRDITYHFAELDEWCLPTRPRSTGARVPKYPAVVIPLSTQRCPMLQRNLVYAGVTRRKRLVVLLGQRKAPAIAVKGARTRRRWSKLGEWLGRQPR